MSGTDHKETAPAFELAGAVRLSEWTRTVGISRAKAWRLRKAGELMVVTRSKEDAKGSNISLLVMQAMSAAEQTGLDSVQVVRKQIAEEAAPKLPAF